MKRFEVPGTGSLSQRRCCRGTSGAEFLKSADESLKRLRVDHIDLYQLHWPNCTVPIAETMAAMEELVDRGKVRFIGVSNFELADLKKAQAALSKRGALRYCPQQDIAVIAYCPAAQGLGHIREQDSDQTLQESVSLDREDASRWR